MTTGPVTDSLVRSLLLRRIVDTAQGFSDQWVKDKHPVTHSHGPEGARSGLEERGVTPVVYITCGAKPDSGDYFSIMEANIQRLTEAPGGA